MAMREIKRHWVDGGAMTDELKLSAVDNPGPGGANHHYYVEINEESDLDIHFQNGAIKEAGVNGVTNEVLLAIVLDRLDGFINGPFDCAENRLAFGHILLGLEALQARTRNRIERGVEGQNVA